ncbi:MAG: tetratricopeptide repeat protein [Thermoanaerobaculia bacterium]|nr:tetratricopeptide repeat protein [Thermoanaerobaculia bacterium]
MAIDRPQVIASAEKLVSRGKIEAAIKEYRKLLTENPNDASTLNRLGDLYARIDRIDEAVRLFSQIADRYTDDGFFVKAIAIYKKIIKLDPTRLAVYERLAELYHKQGLIPEARTQYQVLVDYYQKHDNPASAIGVLQKMAILVPDDPAPHVKLAELFHDQKLTEKALAEYRLIADLMLRHNKVEEATQVYAKAIEAEPGDIAFITDAVLGLKDAGHIGAAARLLALAVERNPQAEKIARIAGLHGARTASPAEAQRATGAPLKVSDVTSGGVESREALHLDSSLLESHFPEPLGHSPPLAPVRPSAASPLASAPVVPVTPPLLRPVDEGEVDFVLELPDDLEPRPSTQVSPTDDMLRRSPESPWFDGGQPIEPEVEFELDLDLDGIQMLEPVSESPASPVSGTSALTPDFEAEPFAAAPPPATASPDPPVAEVELPVAARPHPAATATPPQRPLPPELAPPESEGVYEIDWSFEPEPALDLPDVSGSRMAAPVLNLEELERTSYEVVPPQASGARRQDDLLAEAEVFRKYGLREKAHDRVRELLQLNSRHLGANALLVSLWIDEGKFDRALARANQLKRLAEESQDESVWHQVRNRLVKAGFQVEGEVVVALPVPTPKKKDKISALLDDLAGRSSTAARAGAKPASSRPEASPPPAALRPALPEAPASAQASAVPPAPTLPAPAPPAVAPVAAATELSAEPWHAGLHDAGPLDDELPEIVIPIARPPKSASPAGPAPAATSAASTKSGAAPAKPPAEAGRPAAGVEPPPAATANPLPAPVVPPVAPAQSVTPERLAADESLSWLDQAVAAPRAPGTSEGEKLFDDEEGFFDLAAELEQELSKEDLLTGRDLMPTPQEQSLEEIVEGFKRGVAESLSAEDYDTHYNLGIAYREMGLLDEAIGEFQLASKEPRYLIDCASLLGGCFLEKGLPELAIKWYQRGLEIPNLPEEAFLGMLYDLGNVYVFQNDLDKARKTFVEIYGVNSNYRDVVAKLADLDPTH